MCFTISKASCQKIPSTPDFNFQITYFMKILITGTAGFIGSSLALKLLARGDEVIGIDNVNDYYDVNLKLARLERVKAHDGFTEVRGNLENRAL
ncbi:MAG: UDP-glucuronate 4-epimerase, partial [Candidatus Azotimanducaceae bacterium]